MICPGPFASFPLILVTITCYTSSGKRAITRIYSAPLATDWEVWPALDFPISLDIVCTKNYYVVFNYVDDLLGVGKDQSILDSFDFLLSTVEKLGFPISKSKLAAPSSICNYLGVIVNTKNAALSVPTEKFAEIIKKCRKANNQTKITKQELQSLLGSLMFIHKCVRPTRYFVNRLLEALRNSESKHIKFTADMHKDIAWFREFLSIFNGTASYSHDMIEYAETLEIDTCLTHVGGVWKKTVYSAPLPDNIRDIPTLVCIAHLGLSIGT